MRAGLERGWVLMALLLVYLSYRRGPRGRDEGCQRQRSAGPVAPWRRGEWSEARGRGDAPLFGVSIRCCDRGIGSRNGTGWTASYRRGSPNGFVRPDASQSRLLSGHSMPTSSPRFKRSHFDCCRHPGLATKINYSRRNRNGQQCKWKSVIDQSQAAPVSS